MVQAQNKTQETKQDPLEFIESLMDAVQKADSLALVKLFQKATKAKPKMWGSAIVGFGTKKLLYASGKELDWMVAGFAPGKGKLVLYGLPVAKETALLKKLGKHKVGGGCLYITKLSDVDTAVLTQLIAKAK